MSHFNWCAMSRRREGLWQSVQKTKCHCSWACLSHPPAHWWSLMFMNEKVQRQMSLSDCGLYALAFATDLRHGIDTASPRSYDQAMMRQHYIECLEKGRMAPLPSSTRRVIYHNDQKKTLVQIFCGCRLPNDKKEYVQCFKCSGWYNLDSERVRDWAINSKRKWQCQKCKNCKPLSLCNN